MSTIRTALVNADGDVVNVIVIDPATDWEPPEGHRPYQLEPDSLVGPGWVLEGDTFTPPPAPDPVPAVVLPTIIDLDVKSKDMQAQIDALMDLMLGA